ncbi:MAG: hypothetical protein Q8M94_11435 [Ignavibacteria bacterium]|nr:hypothetical protein [Ignavibacteria bacterium]
MASLIYLGNLYPLQIQIGNLDCEWVEKTENYEIPWIAIIAKGNLIEGVEAMT